jgi:2-C-methyl-D-erythritol 2,4-cyclodiphosphate synthase
MTKLRIGNGFDVHALAPGLPLWLSGVKIEHTKGCVAHSDGDAAIHALCDAMLGALVLGDIGKHFPDSSPELKGVDSKILLSRVYKLVKKQGYYLVNADITIALQNPKIAPYIEQMRGAIATVLGCDKQRISVKATTTEKLGFVGREEGIACWATVLLGCSSDVQ